MLKQSNSIIFYDIVKKTTMRISLLVLLSLFLNLSPSLAQKSKAKEDVKKTIDSLTQDLKKQEGLIISYSKDNKIYFEIGSDLLDKDLLMVTRFVQFPANFQAYQNAGSKTSEQLIHFSKKGIRAVLVKFACLIFLQYHKK